MSQKLDDCLALFDLFGKKSATAANMLSVFDESLRSFSASEIAAAFDDWLANQTSMPKPAEIRKRIESTRAENRRACSAAKPNIADWAAYKRYLHENDMLAIGLHHTIDRQDRRQQQPTPRSVSPDCVPWFGKNWNELTDDLKTKISGHIALLGVQKSLDHAADYCKHLADKAAAPRNLYSRIFGKALDD